MRFVFLSLDFGLFLLALVALLQAQGTSAMSQEICPPDNCLLPDDCEIPMSRSFRCENPEESCCSLVKAEARSLCRHWGGECMDGCNERLTQRSTDCEEPQKCCVLVK